MFETQFISIISNLLFLASISFSSVQKQGFAYFVQLPYLLDFKVSKHVLRFWIARIFDLSRYPHSTYTKQYLPHCICSFPAQLTELQNIWWKNPSKYVPSANISFVRSQVSSLNKSTLLKILQVSSSVIIKF